MRKKFIRKIYKGKIYPNFYKENEFYENKTFLQNLAKKICINKFIRNSMWKFIRNFMWKFK